MQLSWQPGFSLSRKPVKKPTVRRTKRKALNNADKPQQFEFIAEYPVVNHGARYSPSVTSPVHSGEPDEPTAKYQASSNLSTTSQSLPVIQKRIKRSVASDEHAANSRVIEAVEETEPSVETSFWASSDISLTGSGIFPCSKTIYGTTELSVSVSIPPSILYSSLSQRFKPILDRCILFLHPAGLATAH